jgi:hypothetical protein
VACNAGGGRLRRETGRTQLRAGLPARKRKLAEDIPKTEYKDSQIEKWAELSLDDGDGVTASTRMNRPSSCTAARRRCIAAPGAQTDGAQPELIRGVNFGNQDDVINGTAADPVERQPPLLRAWTRLISISNKSTPVPRF